MGIWPFQTQDSFPGKAKWSQDTEDKWMESEETDLGVRERSMWKCPVMGRNSAWPLEVNMMGYQSMEEYNSPQS